MTVSDARLEALKYCFQTTPELVRPLREQAEDINREAGVERHHLLIVLGSGFRQVVDSFPAGAVNARWQLGDLAGVPAPTAEGHGGELVSLNLPGADGKTVAALLATGRSHLYEGLTPLQVCQLVRIAAITGIEAALLTNAGGCLQDWELGELMVITDHLNFTQHSPFSGPVFVDIAQVWDQKLAEQLQTMADRSGVYVALPGPEFQTRAESRWLKNSGADQVGMSTVLEAISLHQLGVKVAGLSLVSDLSFGDQPCTHEEVLAAAAAATPRINAAICSLAQKL